MASRYASRDDMRGVAECFAVRELIKLLGIDRRTLRRWLNGTSKVPWAAFVLAMEHSPFGLSERDASEGFNRYAITQENLALRSRVADLEALLTNQAKLV